MRTPGPWEARLRDGASAVYREGTVELVAASLNAADAEFIARFPQLLGLMKRLLSLAEDYHEETGRGLDTVREGRRELRRLPE